MAIERIFLGWDRPCLASAADWLWERYADDDTWDLGKTVLVVPGRRAGRRLLEVLVERASPRVLVPPRIITAGDLPDQFLPPGELLAGRIDALLAWMHVLRTGEPCVLKALIRHRPDDADTRRWQALAEEMLTIDTELAGELLTARDVAVRAETLDAPLTHDRWCAIAELRERYVETLAESGLADRQDALRTAAGKDDCPLDLDLILIATADLTRMACELVSSYLGRVSALVHAPVSHAEGFDACGRFNESFWQRATIPLDDSPLDVVNGPADQACAAISLIDNLTREPIPTDFDGGGLPTVQSVTVGLGDESLGPSVQRALAAAGVPGRLAVDRCVGDTRPARLLAALARLAKTQRFDDLAGVLRHPDIEAFIDTRSDPDPAGQTNDRALQRAAGWVSLLDRYAQDHLQNRITDVWLGDPEQANQLKAIYDLVASLLPGDGELLRPLPQWSEAISHALTTVYGGAELDRQSAQDTQMIRAFEVIGDALREQALLDPAKVYVPRIAVWQAIELTLARVAKIGIPVEARESGVEVVGWLELQLDDAPVLVVTSMNERSVPQSITGDAILPDGLRTELGLTNNSRRYARDAMMISAMLASRPRVGLIAGRRGPDDEPLSPSRLLLACEPADLPGRVAQFYSASSVSTTTRSGWHCQPESRLTLPVPRTAQPITSMSVTAFRDYLQCPYRFYLKHVLCLGVMDDQAVEMDAGGFGSLAHEVLRWFDTSDLAGAADARAIGQALSDRLDHEVCTRFGNTPRAAIALQREQLRDRLTAWAQWQAGEAAKGWSIVPEHAEHRLTASLDVDGEPFEIVGRIDRIDYHAEHGWRVVDYKTGDTPTDPEQLHRRQKRQWIDLQLPLYSLLARENAIATDMSLGYIVLPKDIGKIGILLAKWTDEEIESAIAQAKTIIRAVRAGVFLPPGDPPKSTFDDGLSRICMDRNPERDRAVARTLAASGVGP